MVVLVRYLVRYITSPSRTFHAEGGHSTEDQICRETGHCHQVKIISGPTMLVLVYGGGQSRSQITVS